MDRNSFFLLLYTVRNVGLSIFGRRREEEMILIRWFFLDEYSVVEFLSFLCNRKLKYAKMYHCYYYFYSEFL